jgi:predicted regulator of Ras-like GTPase activity (Roadblock/LC7/MglB family)
MFKDRLKNAVDNVQGGEAVILMGFDGIPVDSYEAGTGLDIETVGMEFSVVLKEVRKAADMLESGQANEMTVRTDKLAAVLRVVNDGYFLAMALSPEGNVGKAKYLLRVLGPDLSEDLI